MDPKLTLTVPLKQTIEGALTAAGQCIESLFLQAKDDKVDAICMDAIRYVAKSLAGPLQST